MAGARCAEGGRPGEGNAGPVSLTCGPVAGPGTQVHGRSRSAPVPGAWVQCSSRRSSLRSLGASRDVTPTTAIVMNPPNTTAGTSPNARAIVPA